MRKNFITKILPFIFVFIFISLFISSPLAFRSPRHARAGKIWDTISNPGGTFLYGDKTVPNLQVPIGDFTAEKFKDQPPENWLGLYIIAWFNYIVGAAGIFAVYRIMYGGILWITAGGNASQVDDAKGKIKNAVIGIVLLLCTYTIFKTINPRLLSLQLPPIDDVKAEPVCCKDNTTRKKRTAYNECNKDASGKELETKLDIKECALKICDAPNATFCGVKDETNNCIGFNVSTKKTNGNNVSLCLFYWKDNELKGEEKLYSTSFNIGKKPYKVSSAQYEKPCAMYTNTFEGTGVFSFTMVEDMINAICAEPDKSCIVELQDNKELKNYGCK